MIINVKNMVCQRCKIVVNNILTTLGIEAEYISIGEIRLSENLSDYMLRQLNAALKETGLELVFDKQNLLVQKIKNIIIETIHYADEPLRVKLSCYLSSRLNYSYTYLSNIFKKIKLKSKHRPMTGKIKLIFFLQSIPRSCQSFYFRLGI